MKEGFIPPVSEICPPLIDSVPNTSVVVNPDNFDNLRPTINKTLGFVKKASRIISEGYVGRLIEAQNSSSETYDCSAIVNQQLHLPSFKIFDKPAGQMFLSDPEVNYPQEEINSDNILLVYSHPWHAMHAWEKLGTQSPDGTLISRKVIRKSLWGTLGINCKRMFTQMQELYELKQQLHFRRINDIGDHNSDLFYYMYEVSKPQR